MKEIKCSRVIALSKDKSSTLSLLLFVGFLPLGGGKSFGARVRDGSELKYRCWGLNPDPLQEKYSQSLVLLFKKGPTVQLWLAQTL